MKFPFYTAVFAFLFCAVSTTFAFGDVAESDWFKPQLDVFVAEQLLDTSKENFLPGDFAKRNEVVKLLVLLAAPEDVGLITYNNEFADVKATDWFAKYYAVAATNGWLKGQDNCLGSSNCNALPGSSIPRSELAALINRVYGLEPNGLAPAFNDNTQTSWFQSSITSLADNCILQGAGESGLSLPSSEVTRDVMITMLHRARFDVTFKDGCPEDKELTNTTFQPRAAIVQTVSSTATQSTNAATSSSFTGGRSSSGGGGGGGSSGGSDGGGIVVGYDTDGDGVVDSEDNCVVTPNTDQADLNNDGVGDACQGCSLLSEPIVQSFIANDFIQEDEVCQYDGLNADRRALATVGLDYNGGVLFNLNDNSFDDVASTDRHYYYFEEVGADGWFSGGDQLVDNTGCYGSHPCNALPDDRFDKNDFAVFATRAFNLIPSGSAPQFNDNPTGTYRSDAMQIMADRCVFEADGLGNGYPDANMTLPEMFDAFVAIDKNLRYAESGCDPHLFITPTNSSFSNVAVASAEGIDTMFFGVTAINSDISIESLTFGLASLTNNSFDNIESFSLYAQDIFGNYVLIKEDVVPTATQVVFDNFTDDIIIRNNTTYGIRVEADVKTVVDESKLLELEFYNQASGNFDQFVSARLDTTGTLMASADITYDHYSYAQWSFGNAGYLVVEHAPFVPKEEIFIAGQETSPIMWLDIEAVGEDAEVEHLQVSIMDSGVVPMIPNLNIYDDYNNELIATATIAGCVGHNPENNQTYCANITGGDLTVSGTRRVYVTADLLAEGAGGISGEKLHAVIIVASGSGDARVEARGLLSNVQYTKNNGDGDPYGEVHVNPSANLGPDNNLFGQANLTSFSNIELIANAATASSSVMPFGAADFASFEFMTDANGTSDVEIDNLLFTVTANGFVSPPTNFELYENGNLANTVTCTDNLVGGLIEVNCSGLTASAVDSSLEPGTSSVFTLSATLGDTDGYGDLQASLQDFSDIFETSFGSTDSHIQWVDADGPTTFFGVPHLVDTVDSTNYKEPLPAELDIAVDTLSSAVTTVAGAENIILTRFEVTAANDDLEFSEFKFEIDSSTASAPLNSLGHATNYSLYIDNGSSVTLLESGVTDDGNVSVMFDDFTYLLAEDETVHFEVWADVDNSVINGDVLHIQLFNQAAGIETDFVEVDAINGGSLNDNQITYVHDASTVWNFVDAGALFVEQAATSMEQIFVAGQETSPILWLEFNAEYETVNVEHIQISIMDSGVIPMIPNLNIYDEYNDELIATATIAGCVGHNPENNQTYCANISGDDFHVSNFRTVYVTADLQAENAGGISGEKLQAVIITENEPDARIKAEGVISGVQYTKNNGDSDPYGEVHINTGGTGPDQNLFGQANVTSFSKIENIFNAGPANSAVIPTGISDIGSFEFITDSNGTSDVELDGLIFEVAAFNFDSPLTGFEIYEEGNANDTATCTHAGTTPILVTCSGLASSNVDTELEPGTNSVFVLQATLSATNGNGTLEVSLTDYSNSMATTFGADTKVLWNDTDGASGFKWFALPYTIVDSTFYSEAPTTLLNIEVVPTIASNNTVIGADDILLMRFEAEAISENIMLSELIFGLDDSSVSSPQNSLDHANNYSLYYENAGGSFVLLQGGITADPTFIEFDNADYTIAEGETVNFEVRADIPTSTNATDALQIEFLNHNVGTTDSIAAEISGGSVLTEAQKSLTHDTSTLWSFVDAGNLNVTLNAATSSKQLLAGDLDTTNVATVEFEAELEDVRVEQLNFLATADEDSIAYLEIYIDGSTTPVIATNTDCAGVTNPTAAGNLYCLDHDFIIAADTSVSVDVHPFLKAKDATTSGGTNIPGGAVSGDDVTIALVTGAMGSTESVEAYGVTSDDLITGAVATTITSASHTALFAKVVDIQNANADGASSNIISLGSNPFGVFEFTTPDNLNNSDVELDGIIFDVIANNVQFAAGSFALYEQGQANNDVTCTESATTGNLEVVCTGLTASVVDATLEADGSYAFVLEGVVTNNNIAADGTSSTLQASITSFTDPTATVFGSADSHIIWNDSEAAVVSPFFWIEFPTSFVNSTQYHQEN